MTTFTSYRPSAPLLNALGPRTALANILAAYPGACAFDLIIEGRETLEMPVHCSQCGEVSTTFPMTRNFACPRCGAHAMTSLDFLTN